MNISTIEGDLGVNPIEKLLSYCGPEKNLTLGQLQSYFEKIDRYDVLDDTKQLFCKFCLVRTVLIAQSDERSSELRKQLQTPRHKL